ncbi:MAG: SMC family ATPase [Chloroflexota bacterium]
MRLERIALHHFLSHEDTDWAPNGARLVSLVGANGAGKSSLLDGLAFALFDAARGRTDDLVQLGATDMSARVEFTFGGQLYAVERGRTRKAGGKSYLEFQARDGDGWRPLTGDSIRDTQDRIAELLRMDAATFAQAALLMQGRLNAFAEATAAERKRVLGQVLGLDVWARAEQAARGRARDLEARTAAERGQIERMDERLADRGRLEELVAIAQRDLGQVERDTAERTAARDAITSAIAALDAKLAAGDAQRALLAQLEARVAELAGRYREAQGRKTTAGQAVERARAAIAAGEGAAAAAAALPDAAAELGRLEALRDEAASLDETIRTRREAHAAASANRREATAAWQASRGAASGRVDELTAAVAALVPTPCPKCGTPVTPGRDDLVRRRDDASRILRELGDTPPSKPGWMRLEVEATQIGRLEARRRELGHDPAALSAALTEIRRLEALAARADAVADAQASLAEAETAIAAADDEMARITRDGAAARAAVVEAQRALEALEPFREERAARTEDLAAAEQALRYLGARLRQAQEAAVHASAGIAALDQVGAEREALAAAIAALDAEVGVLRRLVAAFGVTGIPARIIEGVLPELEAHANELLADLRPGMSLAIRAQRAKKDGSGVVEALDLVVRDDAGERPLALFSGGERMSVSLALAVGLSRLVARRAGTAIRTLVIDEPDGLDADARRAFGQALRVLAHRGELERVVLVSHHEDLADVADEVYRVSKNGRGSLVELVS